MPKELLDCCLREIPDNMRPQLKADLDTAYGHEITLDVMRLLSLEDDMPLYRAIEHAGLVRGRLIAPAHQKKYPTKYEIHIDEKDIEECA